MPSSAIQERLDGKVVEWMEKFGNEQCQTSAVPFRGSASRESRPDVFGLSGFLSMPRTAASAASMLTNHAPIPPPPETGVPDGPAGISETVSVALLLVTDPRSLVATTV